MKSRILSDPSYVHFTELAFSFMLDQNSDEQASNRFVGAKVSLMTQSAFAWTVTLFLNTILPKRHTTAT